MSLLTAEDVARTYGDSPALRGVDLAVEAGETLALIGPSGCGKSTLLRVLIGLVRPDRGRVVFEGDTVRASNVLRLRRRMGYVIQDGGLFPHLTARANVTLMARHLRWTRAALEFRVGELSALVQLPGDALQRFPAQLSGGQRQRVALMRALMLDPDLLLLDEPLAALDPLIRYDLQEELRTIFARLGKTVILVTHDIAEAAFFADRIVLMRDGAVVQHGAPRELMERPADAFVQRFVAARRDLDRAR